MGLQTVTVYNYLVQMGEIGPWNSGQCAGIFQRGKDNFSSCYLIHFHKAKELLKEETIMLYFSLIKLIEAKYS